MKLSVKNVLTIIAVLFCVAGAAIPAYAAVPDVFPIEPLYVGTTSCGCNLSILESGTATCTGQAKLKSGYTAEGTLTLQRSSSGVSWSKATSWSISISTSALTTFSKSYTVSRGYYYRVQITLKVYNSSGNLVETITKASSSIYY